MYQYIEKYEKDIRESFEDVGEQNQYVCARMLYHFDKFCRENGLKYTIDWGTLLGAFREHDFIKWDLDIDVNMEIEDFKAMWSMDLKNKIPGYFFQYTTTDPFFNSNFTFGRLVDLNSSTYPTSDLRLSPSGSHIDIQCVGKRKDLKELILKDKASYHFKKNLRAIFLSLKHLLVTGEFKRTFFQIVYFSIYISIENIFNKNKELNKDDSSFESLHMNELDDVQMGDIKVMCIKEEYAVKRIIKEYGENYNIPPAKEEREKDMNRLGLDKKFKTSKELRHFYY